MTNKEKYAQEILDIVCSGGERIAMVNHTLQSCMSSRCQCSVCAFNSIGSCREHFAEWCKKEYQAVDWSKVPKDTKVYVRDSENEQWKPRYFANYDEYTDSVMTYNNGATSWSGCSELTNRWNYAELAED